MERSAGHLLSGRNRGEAPSGSGQASENIYSNQSICKNPSCRAVLPRDSIYCRLCSCHLCGLYDKQKDPSLWLTCEPDSPQDDSCWQSCHIKCALKGGNLGVSNGPFLSIDASYWCTSCGKITDILGCWKKQLIIAKDAKFVGVLWDRISLSYRLMGKTSRYTTLHNIVKDLKKQLLLELGSINQMTGRDWRRLANKLRIAHDVQKLLAGAIEMASTSKWEPNPRGREGRLPPACRILVEEASASSFAIRMIDTPTTLMDGVIRFKVWCWRFRLEGIPEEPNASFGPSCRRVRISNLQPSSEYAIRIVSCKETCVLGASEAKCFTKHAGFILENSDPPGMFGPERNPRDIRVSSEIEMPILSVQSEPTGRPEGLPSAAIEQVCGLSERTTEANGSGHAEGFPNAATEQDCGPPERSTEFQALESPHSRSITHQMDLNAPPLPDLNEDPAPPSEPSRAEDDIIPEPGVGCDGHDASQGIQGNATEIGSADKPSSPVVGNVLSVKSTIQSNDERYADCVKKIRRLELEGHITHEFRLKFLSWLSFKSTEKEERVLYSFVDALSDDLQSLAEQLVDSFSDIAFK